MYFCFCLLSWLSQARVELLSGSGAHLPANFSQVTITRSIFCPGLMPVIHPASGLKKGIVQKCVGLVFRILDLFCPLFSYSQIHSSLGNPMSPELKDFEGQRLCFSCVFGNLGDPVSSVWASLAWRQCSSLVLGKLEHVPKCERWRTNCRKLPGVAILQPEGKHPLSS